MSAHLQAANVNSVSAAGSDRRRSTRVLLIIPVKATWTSKDGLQVQEHAETEVVSEHGAMLKMGTRLAAGTQIELCRLASGQITKAKVVGVGNPSPDGLARVAVELTTGSDKFWGISFPPLSAAAAPAVAPAVVGARPASSATPLAAKPQPPVRR